MPVRTDQLIKSIRQMCEARGIRNVEVARAIGVSPQAVWNIFNGKSQVSGEQALALEELLLKDQIMKPHFVDPPAMPRETNEPKTLGSAKEMLAELRAELAQLKGSPAPKPAAQLPTLPAVRPVAARTTPPAFDMLDPKTWTGKIAVTAFPETCNSPKAITEYLSTLSTEALRSHLNSTGATTDTKRLQQKLTFAELQNRKSRR